MDFIRDKGTLTTLIYPVLLGEDQVIRRRVKKERGEKERGGYLPVWRPDRGSIVPFLSALLVRPVKDAVGGAGAVDRYSSGLCLPRCGQRSNSSLIC